MGKHQAHQAPGVEGLSRTAAGLALGLTVVVSVSVASRVDAAKKNPEFVKVASANDPIGLARNQASKAVYIVEQGGRLREMKTKKYALDLRKEVSNGGEQGLLGAAFSPDGRELYTNHTNKDGNTEVTSWTFTGGVASVSSRQKLLEVKQPYSNHNGGGLFVTSDGVLWIGLGDGGSGGDPKGNGQKLDTLLGKLLRIKPNRSAKTGYDIPAGNLDASKGRPEIWAYGLRNPWQFFIDETLNRVWIGDVGQNAREEVNMVTTDTPTPNFGWNKREGIKAYEDGEKPADAIDPIHDYAHGEGDLEGCSVSGGVVFKGNYLFTDYCRGTIRSVGPDGSVKRIATKLLSAPTAMGYDANGNVLIVSKDGGIYRLVIGT
jgi:glucose/arabinose dehydrogenase